MLTFADYTIQNTLILEARLKPRSLRVFAIFLAVAVTNIEKQLKNETDPIKRDQLIARQNSLNSYLTTLSIAAEIDDPNLARRFRSIIKN